MVAEFKKRHDYVIENLKSIPDIEIIDSDGTFYCFPCIKKILQKKSLDSDVVLAEHLLLKGIAVVPGSVFGAPGHIRLSFALNMAALKIGMMRLKEGLT